MKQLLTLLTLITIVIVASAQTQAPPEYKVMVRAWNECAASIVIENDLFNELSRNLHMNPPWRVLDARAPALRAELIDKIIVEHKRRIKLLETIKAEDSK